MPAISPLRKVAMTGSDWLTSMALKNYNFLDSTPEAGLSRFLFLKPVELPISEELLNPEELFII